MAWQLERQWQQAGQPACRRTDRQAGRRAQAGRQAGGRAGTGSQGAGRCSLLLLLLDGSCGCGGWVLWVLSSLHRWCRCGGRARWQGLGGGVYGVVRRGAASKAERCIGVCRSRFTSAIHAGL